MFLSRDEKMKYTPSEKSGRWAGERGNSVCAPKSEESRALLEAKGMDGVRYTNGEPDFSPFSESTVELGYMTTERHSKGVSNGRDGKNTTYTTFNEDGTVERSHKADPNSMADLHMKYDTPGNFEQADILTAQKWTEQNRDGREWTAQDVADYRKANDLTWHERGDGTTMDMVPRAINDDFDHAGGVAEMKERDRIIAEEAENNPEFYGEEFDWDNATDEEIAAEQERQEREWYSYGDGSSDAGDASAATDNSAESDAPSLDKEDDVNQTARPNNDPVATPPDESPTPDEEESMDDLVPLPQGAEEAQENDNEEEESETEELANPPAPADPGIEQGEDEITPPPAEEEGEEEEEMPSMDDLAEEEAEEAPSHPQEEQEEQEADMADLTEDNDQPHSDEYDVDNTPEQETDHNHDINT